MQFLRMSEQDLAQKTVLIREDLNVPLKNGNISNDARLQASLPTIQLALTKGAGVIVCSHLGRPDPKNPDPMLSLQPIAAYLSEKLARPVKLITDYLQPDVDIKVNAGEVVLLENVRFNAGEKKNDTELAKRYASLCDVFVMDAFGTAHRAEASTEGVIHQAKVACAGPLLANELDALSKALNQPEKPVLAIVGGSKVSSKLDVLNSLANVCDQIIVGGGIANTFLAATGINVGVSLYEPDLVESAKAIMQKVQILLPTDVVVADNREINFDDFLTSLENTQAISKDVKELKTHEAIYDIGVNSAKNLAGYIQSAKTILWNGPVGVFEVDTFGNGTQTISQAIFASRGFSIAGGGDTLAAIAKYKVADGVSYISTGGGAFLEFVEGKTLPAVAALQQRVS